MPIQRVTKKHLNRRVSLRSLFPIVDRLPRIGVIRAVNEWGTFLMERDDGVLMPVTYSRINWEVIEDHGRA